ncbi:hypothetical protein ACO0M4_12020 [Streptomyces sp. RGM 3693]|uniref:hypothetical protein n=1 Tax=Streptomyces sp. RGM 3693 TaxID=3413284 RepID=UPI003D2AF833
MIGEDAATRKIRMLCVELLHRCNVGCWYWFYGMRLRHDVDQSGLASVAALTN